MKSCQPELTAFLLSGKVYEEVYSFGIQKSCSETKLYTLYTLYT